MSNATSSSRCDVPVNDFSALAGKLQETAEAVLAFCRSASGEAETPKEKPLGEYRQYRLPAHTLREEKELLERYTDSSNGYNALDVSTFKHLRMDHSELFAYKSDRITGSESF